MSANLHAVRLQRELSDLLKRRTALRQALASCRLGRPSPAIPDSGRANAVERELVYLEFEHRRLNFALGQPLAGPPVKEPYRAARGRCSRRIELCPPSARWPGYLTRMLGGPGCR